MPFGSCPALAGDKEGRGEAEDWNWTQEWYRWWQMETIQEQDLLGTEAGVSKSLSPLPP